MKRNEVVQNAVGIRFEVDHFAVAESPRGPVEGVFLRREDDAVVWVSCEDFAANFSAAVPR